MEVDLLRQVPLFESLPLSELENLAANLARRTFPAGSLLMREGQAGERFYILLEGVVEIIKALGTPGQRVLGLRYPGIFLGEMSLFNRDGFHTASVAARTDLHVMEMTRADFDALLARHPTLAYTMTRILSQRLEEADNQTTRDLLEKNRLLLKAYDETILGWSLAMGMRDQETEAHLLRVKDLTVQLAEQAGIPDEEIAHVRRGALLHDIGKIGVPDGILFKPGKLTDPEMEIMRKHTTHAYDLLSNIEYLRPAVDIPYCHHEKWDGTGYPRKLKGEEIPLAARLFAVVDVWDALRSDRPYHTALPEEQVFPILAAGSGAHFDPRAVDLFFQMAGRA
jgi:putative nucleotidyltransferase with HDIG domain